LCDGCDSPLGLVADLPTLSSRKTLILARLSGQKSRTMTFTEFTRMYPEYFWLFAFVLGAVWGSFLNVCIYRLPLRKSVVYPGSHCYQCGSAIRWYDNIPLLSYWILRGNCRFCGSHFSARYFYIELLTALLFWALCYRFGFQAVTIAHWILVALLIVATFTDLDHYVIPDSVTNWGLAFAIVANGLLGSSSLVVRELHFIHDFWFSFSFAPDRPEWWWASGHVGGVVGAIVGALVGWSLLTGIAIFGRLLFRKEAMGGGDIKLFAFLGAYFGPLSCFWILFLSAFLGSIGGSILLLAHRLWGQDEYDEFALDPARARRPPLPSNAERRNSEGPVTASSGTEVQESLTCDGEQQTKPRTVRIARRTGRQLHHFPFGPYIALAAVIVLFFHDTLDLALRDYLLLPSVVEEPVEKAFKSVTK